MGALDAEMLSQLTQGLGDDFWDAAPTPDPSPVKPKSRPPPSSSPTPITPTKSSRGASTAKPVPSSTLFSATNHDLAEFLQGSEHWNLDEDPFSPIKAGPSKPPKQPAPPKYAPDPCTRCVVTAVADEYVNNRWRKSISGQTQPQDEIVQVYLCDDWYQTEIRPGDIFNVIGTFAPAASQSPRTIHITAAAHLFILHPDLLTTATALSTASQCRRKPLLSGLVRATSDITPALVYGSVLHEVMQRCLLEGRWEEAFVERCIADAVHGALGDLVKLGLSVDIAKREVADRAKGLIPFKEKYLGDEPKKNGAMTNTRTGKDDAPALLAITKLLGIEEDIWSPTYGLKGKIDATVQGIIIDPPPAPPRTSSYLSSSSAYNSHSQNLPPPNTQPTRTSTPFPLELKTGRALAGMEHRAQTLLYTLLLSERYGADVQDGLLFYSQSEDGAVVRVPRGRNEIRALIGVRNELAAWGWRRVRKRREAEGDVSMDVDGPSAERSKVEEKMEVGDVEHFLPPPIDEERACARCYALDTCLLFRKTHPDHSSSPSSSPSGLRLSKRADQEPTFDPPIPPFLQDVFRAKTAHLTPAQTAFFRTWEALLALEERDLVRFKRELWTLGSVERERRGRCWGGMVLRSLDDREDADAELEELEPGAGEWGVENQRKIHRYTYAFRRARAWDALPTPTQGGDASSLLHGHLGVGDPVTVSVEPNMLALARGYILRLDPAEVVLGVDRRLDPEELRGRVVGAAGAAAAEEEEGDEVVFRIDKDELFGGMARVRGNLAQLFYADGDRKRLELVVDLRKPVFRDAVEPPLVHPSSPSSPSSSFSSSKAHEQLNPSQLGAMEHVLRAEDYALVLGMPGTGKTTVIAALIRELVGRGKTVLLSSYTHSAVDTILMRLAEEEGGFGILRLGNVDKVHPDVRKYTLSARKTATTVEQFELQIMAPPVVATTCLTIDHPLFFRRKFDYCIVDEASQITLPTCLGPLRFADTFVLVGDHFQLPPLVKNPEARKGGLDVSLFRRLSEAHPEAVVDLRFQYRMNADIMLLSNRLIYDDRLRCGNEAVARASLALGDRGFLGRLHPAAGACVPQEACWLEKLVDESCKAVFVDTDALPAAESRVGDLVQNTIEAELVRQLTETLLQCGVQESQIGIISLYRQQVKVLHHLLQERKGVEILTADKSQGRDKECIIISLVRSNDGGHIGDLVKDWRRMNVSFTRARKKLVIFGSRTTLQREPLLASFFELMEKQRWIVALSPNAHTAHASVFDVASTPSKRGAVDEEEQEEQQSVDDRARKSAVVCRKVKKENAGVEGLRPMKKLKAAATDVGKKAGAGVLKGRPILRDLVGHEM